MTSDQLVQWVGIGKDVLLAIAGLVTAIVAIRGLRTWQVEQRGQADFAAARDLLRATYKVRDALDRARNEFVFRHEWPDDYDHFQKSAEESSEGWAHVFQARWDAVQPTALDLQTLTVEAEVLWGGEIRKACARLLSCCSMLNSAMSAFVSNERSGGIPFSRSDEYAAKMKARLYRTTEDYFGDVVNPFTAEIEASVNEIDRLLRVHIAAPRAKRAHGRHRLLKKAGNACLRRWNKIRGR